MRRSTNQKSGGRLRSYEGAPQGQHADAPLVVRLLLIERNVRAQVARGVLFLQALPLLAALAACAQQPPTATAIAQPTWLQRKIAEYQNLPPFNPPRSIVRATYQGKTVYYVSAACCDLPSELYDERGTLVCYPDGGFAGGDGRCPLFATFGQSISTVWRDDRGRARPGKEPAAR